MNPLVAERGPLPLPDDRWADRLVGRSDGRSAWRRIAPIAILLSAIFVLAPEMQFSVADLAFPPYRILTIVMLAVVAPRLLSGQVRYCAIDIAIVLACCWMIVSFCAFYGLLEGLTRSAAIAIDTLGSYLVARACIRTPDDLRRLLIVLAPFVALAGFVMAVEAFTHRLLYRAAFTSVFGPLPSFAGGEVTGTLNLATEVRLGLQRAFGPFSHPILGGVILGSTLPVFALSAIRSWPRVVGMIGACGALFSISSIAVLALAMALGGLLTNYLLLKLRTVKWAMVLSVGALALGVVHFASKSGLINVISRVTLNPHTAFYRQVIWEYGWASMLRYPLFGVGYSSHERPYWLSGSIDAHFLMLGVRHGFVTPTLLLLGVVMIMWQLGTLAKQTKQPDRSLLIGLNLTLGILLLSSMTVAYYSESNIWFMALLGTGASLASSRPARTPFGYPQLGTVSRAPSGGSALEPSS